MNRLAERVGGALARFLSRRRAAPSATEPVDVATLQRHLRPGDVLLVEGQTRFSVAIKFLTQSTWSHAALYAGDLLDRRDAQGRPLPFIEADVVEGVRAVPVDAYAGLAVRICRPVGLSPQDLRAVVDHAAARLGQRYDLKNVVDLVRYLLPTPPVPVRWRRRMLALGSGDPTRAICSTMIAEAFHSVRYPILPEVERRAGRDPGCKACEEEVLRIRHHSLFVPRDFDVSPYFAIVKPTLDGFDPQRVRWADWVRLRAQPGDGPAG
jgi:hypothetical protein